MRRRAPLLLAGVLALAVLVWVGFSTLGPGDAPEPDSLRGARAPGGAAGSPEPPVPAGPESDPPREPAGEPVAPEETSVRGIVLYRTGEPAEGARVGFVRTWSAGSELRGRPPAVVGADGRFRIEGVPARGARLAVFPALPETVDLAALRKSPVFVTAEVEVRAGEEVDLGVIYLDPPAAIAGRVVEEGGRPVRGATVTAALLAGNIGRRSAETDGDGRFRLEGLLAGEYYLVASRASPGGGLKTCRLDRVVPGGPEVLLRLADASALLLRFLSVPDRRPLPLRSGILHPEGSFIRHRFGGSRTSVPRTEWKILLAPGSYSMTFSSPGFRVAEFPQVEIREGRVTVLDVALTRE